MFLVKYVMKHLNTLSHFSLAATGGMCGVNTVLLQTVTASAGSKCPLYFDADRGSTSARSHSAEE